MTLGKVALFSGVNSEEGTHCEWPILLAAEEMNASVLQVGSR